MIEISLGRLKSFRPAVPQLFKEHVLSTPLFTIFTPTFNRAHTLGRVYDSLSRQTFRDFEWLIVDDGSTDGTKALIERFRREASFPIRYEYQENKGKNEAFNRGALLAYGELLYNVDSDDELLPDALDKLAQAWRSCPSDRQHQYSGVTGLCLDVHGKIVGNEFPHSPLDSNTLEAVYRYKITGEKSGFVRTSVLREFPFPSVEGAKLIPESVVWTRMGRKYITRFINEPLRIYHRDSGNQLTAQPARMHARGRAFWYSIVLNEQIDYFRYAPQEFLRSAVQYVRLSLHAGERGAIWAQLNNPIAKGLVVLSLPIALIAFYWDRAKAKP